MSRSKSFRASLAFAGLSGSLSLLFYLGDPRSLSLPPPPLLLLLLLNVSLEILGRAERLRRLGMIWGQKISLWRGARINALADFFGAVTPAGVGGDVSRLAQLHRMKIRMGDAVALLASEGIIKIGALLVLLLLMASAGLLSSPFGSSLDVLASSFSTVLFYLGFSLLLAAVLVGILRYKGVSLNLRALLIRFDLVGLSLALHILRITRLPLVVFIFSHAHVSSPDVVLWSLVLSYGLGLVPIPSGGGSMEVAFMAALGPMIGSESAANALVWWRLSDHYLFVACGAAVMLAQSMGWLKARRIFNPNQPVGAPVSPSNPPTL